MRPLQFPDDRGAALIAAGSDTSALGRHAYVCSAESSRAPCLPVQGGRLRAYMPDLESDSGASPLSSGLDSSDFVDIVGEEMRQANAILTGRSFFWKR